MNILTIDLSENSNVTLSQICQEIAEVCDSTTNVNIILNKESSHIVDEFNNGRVLAKDLSTLNQVKGYMGLKSLQAAGKLTVNGIPPLTVEVLDKPLADGTRLARYRSPTTTVVFTVEEGSDLNAALRSRVNGRIFRVNLCPNIKWNPVSAIVNQEFTEELIQIYDFLGEFFLEV